MRRLAFPMAALAAALLLAGQACEEAPLVVDNLDEPGSDADTRHRVDATREDVGPDTTLDTDVDQPSRSGPLTFVVDERALLAERLCDHDSDGVLDNAMAELGPPSSEILQGVVTAGAQAAVDMGFRSIFHFPWIEDLAGPAESDTLVIVFSGVDVVDQGELDDDFSGEEPFFASPGGVDGCGEPRESFPDITIENDAGGGGRFEAHVGVYSYSMGKASQTNLGLGDATIWGWLEPWGRGGEVKICGYFVASDLGRILGDSDLGNRSWLENLLAGGAAFGVPTLQGISPDIDLDGDGLETFELDSDFHVTRCIDGDSTPIDGLDCWQDERIADAFAFVAWFHLVPAVFAGLQPGWENHPANPDSCETPPEQSLWDPR